MEVGIKLAGRNLVPPIVHVELIFVNNVLKHIKSNLFEKRKTKSDTRLHVAIKIFNIH